MTFDKWLEAEYSGANEYDFDNKGEYESWKREMETAFNAGRRVSPEVAVHKINMSSAYGQIGQEGDDGGAPRTIWAEPDGDEVLIHNGAEDLEQLIHTGYLYEYIRCDIHAAELIKTRDDALEEAAGIALALRGTPMPSSFRNKYKETAIWDAGADNHAAQIGIAIRAMKGQTNE